MFKALKVSVAILNLRTSIGSQWNLFRVDELESVKPVTTRARVGLFCVRFKRSEASVALSCLSVRCVRVSVRPET